MEQAEIDRLRQDSIAPQKMLIDGVLRASQSEEAMDVISPIDGRVLPASRVAHRPTRTRPLPPHEGYEAGTWRNMPPMARRAVLLKWADLIEAEIPSITVLGVRDNGTEIGMAEKAEAGSAIRTIGTMPKPSTRSMVRWRQHRTAIWA